MKKLFSQLTLQHIKTFAKAHKIISLLIVAGIISAGYGTFKPVNTSAETHYVLGTVATGTVESSVSGTGQVSASDQVNVSAQASGYITSVNVQDGDEVSTGDLLASIDPGDAYINVQNAQLALAKLTEAPQPATLVQSQEAVVTAQNAEITDYNDALNDITSASLDLPSVFAGMNDLLYGSDGYLNDSSISALGSTATSYVETAGTEFDQAQREYTAMTSQYNGVSATSATSTKDSLIAANITMLNDLLTSMTEAEAAVNYVDNIPASSSSAANKASNTLATTAETNLSNWTNEMSTHLTAITSDQTNIANAPANLAEAQDSLNTLEQGPDPLDIQSDQLALAQAQQNYSDYSVVAPFSGIVGKLDVSPGNSVSTGTTVATLISKNQLAVISLNEVDAANVKLGDKAIMTFNAVSGLSLTGTVSSIDLVGTVTSGVVTYNATVTFDTEDPRVLTGMSVSVTIITAAHADVLTVPSGAIKSNTRGSYVLVFNPALPATGGISGVVSTTPPQMVSVVTGLSDNTNTEIVSGLTAGEQVVTRVITPTTSTAVVAAAPSILGSATAGRGGGGGGAARL